jgi:hypothetical protein
MPTDPSSANKIIMDKNNANNYQIKPLEVEYLFSTNILS